MLPLQGKIKDHVAALGAAATAPKEEIGGVDPWSHLEYLRLRRPVFRTGQVQNVRVREKWQSFGRLTLAREGQARGGDAG
jgi:hypothetical protein